MDNDNDKLRFKDYLGIELYWIHVDNCPPGHSVRKF